MLETAQIALFGLLGITAGTLAGLLGIGGGMVIVPGLFYIFTLMKFPEESLMHMAAGTSMCIMICTATSSTLSHHLKGHIQWPVFRNILAGIGLGVLCGNLLGNHLHTDVLELIFGLFLLSISAKIFLDFKPGSGEQGTPGFLLTSLVGTVIGFKSGVLGIGGGAISVPFLMYSGLPMRQVSGTSASFTLPIAIIGTTSFMVFGNSALSSAIPGSTGYIYWPAFCLVAPFTMLSAPFGAKLSQVIPADKMRTVFACFLLFLSFKMLSGTEPVLVMKETFMAALNGSLLG